MTLGTTTGPASRIPHEILEIWQTSESPIDTEDTNQWSSARKTVVFSNVFYARTNVPEITSCMQFVRNMKMQVFHPFDRLVP